MNIMSNHWTLLLTIWVGLATVLRAQDPVIDISNTADGGVKQIPIFVAGYTGEVGQVLRFDLEVAGFKIVAEDSAQYSLSGRNETEVEGRLTDRLSKASLLAKRYTDASPRTQAHALADDVISAILHTPGFCRTKIAFKTEHGSSGEISIVDYDGHNVVELTKDRAIVAAPAWAPGRRSLFYTSYRAGYPDIYSHVIATGERKPVARYAGLNTSAAISPDGRRIAMILSKAGSPDLFVSDIDGSNLLQLTKTKEDESSPCWSPDGSKICVVSRLSGTPALYTVSARGGEMTRLRTAGVTRCTEPDWSPDGKTIVFTAQMGGFQICTVPATGGEAKLVADGEDPSWAPNSRTVVFVRRTKGQRSLSLLDVPTKRVKNIPLNLGNCSQPAWAK